MSQTGVEQYLSRLLIDEDFRDLAAESPEETFKDFELTPEERSDLTRMERGYFATSTKLGDKVARVGFIRSILTVERTVERVAYVPPWSSGAGDLKDRLTKITAFSDAIQSLGGDERRKKLAEMLDLIEPREPPEPKPEPTDSQHTSLSADIVIVGLGINGFDQVTPETIRALKRAKHVFFIGNGVATRAFIEQFCQNTTDLMDSYSEGGDRLDAYKAMALLVVDAALDNKPVVLAEYGHPVVFSFPPFLIKRMAQPLGLKVAVLPAVSAMDCIFAELMIDPCENGLLIYEATDILIRRRKLVTDVSVLIWQVGSVETALYSRRGSKPDRYNRISSYLLEFYPAGHEITAIYASNFPLMPSTVYRFPLASLPSMANVLHPGFTLFIPPVEPRKTADYELARLARSSAHLDIISADR